MANTKQKPSKRSDPEKITARLDYTIKDDPEIVRFIVLQAAKNERSIVAQMRAMIRHSFERSA